MMTEREFWDVFESLCVVRFPVDVDIELWAWLDALNQVTPAEIPPTPEGGDTVSLFSA